MKRVTARRVLGVSGGMVVGLLVVAVVCMLVGSAAGWGRSGRAFAATVVSRMGGGEWWEGWAKGVLREAEMSTLSTIIFAERLPRVLLGVIVGAGLAAAGVVFQGLLRNPLASPYILGVSAGGALGAVTAMRLSLMGAFMGLSYMTGFSFVGALAAIALVYWVGSPGGRTSSVRLILAGVIVNAFFSSVTMFLNYTADFTQSRRIVTWLMGGLYLADYARVWQSLPWVALGLVVLWAISRDLNVLSFGDQAAAQLGVSVERAKRVAFFGGSLVTGVCVSVSGPIGFVGLVIPHTMRFIFGPDHRLLLPTSAIAGGGFLVACDTLARVGFGAAELPVGVITAFVGGPFFVWLLRRSGRRRLAG